MNTLASVKARMAGKRERELAWWALMSAEAAEQRAPRKAMRNLPSEVKR